MLPHLPGSHTHDGVDYAPNGPKQEGWWLPRGLANALVPVAQLNPIRSDSDQGTLQQSLHQAKLD